MGKPKVRAEKPRMSFQNSKFNRGAPADRNERCALRAASSICMWLIWYIKCVEIADYDTEITKLVKSRELQVTCLCKIFNRKARYQSLLEFREAVRACAMRPISGFKVHSPSLLFFGVFSLYLLLFCSLQYIYEDLYRSYPSVCPVGTTVNLIFCLILLI
jgi:hypothetical protein